MASLKDRTGYPAATASRVRTMSNFCLSSLTWCAGWIGLIVCAAGFLLLLGEGLAAVSGVTRHPL